MATQICPLLCTFDSNSQRAEAVEFPSFENECLANGTPELILLGDQATHCLSAAFATCPRFRSSRYAQEQGAGYVPFYATAEEAWRNSAPAAAGMHFGYVDDQASAGENHRGRWGKLGAALIFATVLLCGSMTAAYSGWEWISGELRPQTAAGRVDVAGAQDAPTPAIYVVMTATPEQVAVAVQPPPDSGANGAIIPVLPQAVTPTPIQVQLDAFAAAPTAAATDQAGERPDASGQPPELDVDLLVPTRRPTPVFDVPTSTPLPEAPTLGPTDTPTLTPTPMGTPVVIFAPVAKELMKGECTLVRWNVMNVREVYYENLPMNGQGEREECINDENEVYTLMVVLPNGVTQIYTTTVAYLPPTPTPTVTPSFTPEPVFTPTWTPEPATPTPPPNLFYSVNLSINGSSEVNCGAGQTCEVGLLVTNGGSGTDNVSVLLLAQDVFPVQLCRPDGVCGGSSVPINNMGSGNTAFVVARISVPADAAPQSRSTATFQARSDGSGGGVTSNPVTVAVTVP